MRHLVLEEAGFRAHFRILCQQPVGVIVRGDQQLNLDVVLPRLLQQRVEALIELLKIRF